MSRFIENLESRQLFSVAPVSSHMVSLTNVGPTFSISPADDTTVGSRHVHVYTVINHKQVAIPGASVTATWQDGKLRGNLDVSGAANDLGIVTVSGRYASKWFYTVSAPTFATRTFPVSGPKKPTPVATDGTPLKAR